MARCPMRVAWIGLGTMGNSMAGHVLAAGHQLSVYNRTPARAAELVGRGATGHPSPAEAAAGAEVVFTCVSDSPDLEAVVLGEHGAAATMGSGSVLVDCSTISPAFTRTLAETLVQRGIDVVDAPVSGGSEGAAKGILTTFVGGRAEAVERVRPLLETFARSINVMGEPGAGQAAKMINQVVLGGAYAAVAEAMVLADREGLPLEALIEAMGAGAAQSWVLANRAMNVVRGTYPLGFKAALYGKDLGIAIAEADRVGLELPVTRLAAALNRRVVEAGHGDEDVSNFGRVARGEV